VIEGGGQTWGQAPIKPKGFPKHLEESATVGPEFAHITLYISPRRAFDQKIVRGFEGIQEYHAQLLYGGRGHQSDGPGTRHAMHRSLSRDAANSGAEDRVPRGCHGPGTGGQPPDTPSVRASLG
jgi:hypothetical protein